MKWGLFLIASSVMVAFTLVPPSTVAISITQENDYLAVEIMRMGKYELGRPLEVFGLGKESAHWEIATARAPYATGYWFADAGIAVYTCNSDGLAIAVIAFHVPGAPAGSQAEAAKYRTTDDVRIGTPESELSKLLWWRPERLVETTVRIASATIAATEYVGAGILIYIGHEDRRVIGLGVTAPGLWSSCQEEAELLQTLRETIGKPPFAIARPVALTTCEVSELRRRLFTEPDTRRLFNPVLALAKAALEEPPSPLSRLFIQDLMPTDPRVQVSMQFFYRDVRRTEALGYAFAATGDDRYAERAAGYLEAWARVNQPNGQPITETEIVRLVRGFSLVAEQVPHTLRAEVANWLSRLASLQIDTRPQWELVPPWGPNNHHSHRLKIVGVIGYALDDRRLIRYAEEGYRRQVAENLRPDGSSLDFHVRDALHYHVYNLEPLLELAIVADKNGVNLYGHRSPLGASLERSIAFLLPYVRGERVHREFVRSAVALDRQRGEAGVPGFGVGAPWDPSRAAHLLEMAGYFDPAFSSVTIHGRVRRTYQTVLNGLRTACSPK